MLTPFIYSSPFDDISPLFMQRPISAYPMSNNIDDFFRKMNLNFPERTRINNKHLLRVPRHSSGDYHYICSPEIPIRQPAASIQRFPSPERRELYRHDHDDENRPRGGVSIPITDARQNRILEERNSKVLTRSSIAPKPTPQSITPTLSQPAPKTKTSDEMLRDRLSLYGLKEKTHIKGDGNCQFTSCADQLFNDPSRHCEVRKEAVEWLRANKDYKLPNSTTLGDYLQTEFFPCWEDYIEYMSQDGIWGDHYTLLAIAEVYKTKIVVVSSMDVDPGIDPFTVIVPKRFTKTIYISHLHELHYSSLTLDD